MVETHLLNAAGFDRRFAPTEITRGEKLVSVTQGLIVYIEGSLQPVWNDVIKVWNTILQSLPTSFRYARLWNEVEWRTIDGGAEARLRHEIQASGGDRGYWKVEFVDKYPLPDMSFEFQDVQNTLGHSRASYIRLRLPVAFPVDRLLEIAHSLSRHLPILQGSGGYMFNVDERERDLAYDQVWAWARRYWGVQVVDPRKGTWDAPRGLLGVNWLTIVGRSFFAGKLSQLAADPVEDKQFAVHLLENALILRAGPMPLLGDLNTFEDLTPYVAASHAVRAAFTNEPNSFRGMFSDHQSTLSWIRRYEEPAAWVDPELVDTGATSDVEPDSIESPEDDDFKSGAL
jgi:hypothetical protein